MTLSAPVGLTAAHQDRLERFEPVMDATHGIPAAFAAKTDVSNVIADLLSTASGKGASQIGIQDSGGLFTATSVEGALAELAGAGGAQVDLIFAPATELTIAGGAITTTQAAHTVDTEADAASDDLDTINGMAAEELVLVRPASGARTVVLKHGTGNIFCPGGQDIPLAEATDWALLASDGTNVVVVAKSTLVSDAVLNNDSRLSDARTPLGHGSSHTSGADDIQDATPAQKGLMTAAYAAEVTANTATLAAAASTTMGIERHIKVSTPGGVTADTDTALPPGTWEPTRVEVINRAGGTAGDTIQVIAQGIGTITDAMDVNKSDAVITRPTTLAAGVNMVGGTNALRVTETDGAGNDSPACDVHVWLRQVA